MELFRTNDVVVISYVKSMLGECGIGVVVLDENVSVLDGSIGILPRRLMVLDEDHSAAVHQLNAAGLAYELKS
ncbi:MAG: DUF2007 domain-containing protein [Sphingomonadales bacterium]|nr:DUF2007 domain-containing protein [Sphingomonadales bacterium]